MFTLECLGQVFVMALGNVWAATGAEAHDSQPGIHGDRRCNPVRVNVILGRASNDVGE